MLLLQGREEGGRKLLRRSAHCIEKTNSVAMVSPRPGYKATPMEDSRNRFVPTSLSPFIGRFILQGKPSLIPRLLL